LAAAAVIATPAIAANPHFVRADAAGPNSQGNLAVNFKIAGLGDNQTITVTTTANATALYASQNNGGNFPSDPKKRQCLARLAHPVNSPRARTGRSRAASR
jgi:hypothetical protein